MVLYVPRDDLYRSNEVMALNLIVDIEDTTFN